MSQTTPVEQSNDPERIPLPSSTGYLHPGYAETLEKFGAARALPRCKGWILKRRIPGFPLDDAMGCYPLFACQDWSSLASDLEEVADELVSLAVVTDPFGAFDDAVLKRCFQDLVVPFKQHFVIDLAYDPRLFVSSHHQRNVRRALRSVDVEVCVKPTYYAGEWRALYESLIQRHHIQGISAFSPSALDRQLSIPGLVMFRAAYQQAVAGITLWYVQGDVGYYHLGAYSDVGYRLGASFALFWRAIEHFAALGLRWLNLGGGAGVGRSGTDGLTRFKQGWSTGTRTAYFCGRIFDQRSYRAIMEAKNIPASSYFPAYRRGEFR
jgi:hypothetical protein